MARRRPLSLTSLIDVIFLLLLFFMLSSTFTRFGKVDLAAGGQGGAGPAPDIFLTVDGQGLRLNGLAMDLEGAAEAVTDLVAQGAKTALLLPGGDASTQDLVAALDRLGAIAPLQITVAR